MEQRRHQLFQFFSDFFRKNREQANPKFEFSPAEESALLRKYFNRYFDGASCFYPLQSDSDEDLPAKKRVPKKPQFYGNSGWEAVKEGVRLQFSPREASQELESVLSERKATKKDFEPRIVQTGKAVNS